ncbi:MAG: DUF4340 domain-containing protein [Ruminococcus sp.]|nr:DUF4340 domain-containing protein [Ruminococcus sp.]
MKNKKKLIIISSIVAVLLIGIMLLLIFLPKGGEENQDLTDTIDQGTDMSLTTDESGVHQAQVQTNEKGEIDNNSYGTLVDYIPADIKTIHVENKAGTMDIKSETPVNENGETQATIYTLVGYEDFELQTGVADAVANDAAKIEFLSVISLDGKKASECGLDDPRATVTVEYTDGTKSVVIVGSDAPQSAGTYVKFGTSETIYLVAAEAVDSFTYGVNDLFSVMVNDTPSDSNNLQYSKVSLSGTNFPKEIVFEPNSDFTKNAASCVLVSPDKWFASEVGTSNITGAVRGLVAEKVIMVNPSDNQLSELGLAKPYARLEVVYPDETITLLASAPDSEGKVNFMVEGEKVVYKYAAEKLPWVTISYNDVVTEYVMHSNISAVSQLVVNNGSATYNFALSTKETASVDDDGNEDTTTTTVVKYGDKEINSGYFSTYFQNITLLERSDLSSASASGDRVLTVEFKYADGSTDKVEFVSTGASTYLAVVNGKTLGNVHKTNVDKICNQTKLIAENKDVANLLA